MDGDAEGVAPAQLQREPASMTNGHNDRPRSLSSQADSELRSVHSDDDHRDQRTQLDDTTESPSSLVPTGIQLERYAHDYSLHTDYLARYRSGAVTEGIFSLAQPFGPPHPASPGELPEDLGVAPTGTLWSDDEKQRLFGSLARRSRWRPDLIALDVKTKSESQIAWYLDTLKLMSDMEKARRPDRLVPESSIWREGYAPVAREVSSRWIEIEETLAVALMHRQIEDFSNLQSVAEEKELQRKLRPLTSLKVYNDIKGHDSLLTKTLLRKSDYTDQVEQANLILQEQEQKDVRKFLSELTRRRLGHISAGLAKSKPDDRAMEPRDLDENGTIPLDLYHEIEARWKEDESRLAVLKRGGKDRWTLEESIEAESLRKKVSARKKEMKEFEERIVRAEENEVVQDVIEEEARDTEGENVHENGDGAEVELKEDGRGRKRKRKRRQKKVKKEQSPDDMVVDQEAGDGDDRSTKKAKLGFGALNLTSGEEAGANGASVSENDQLNGKPRTIKPREHLFTRKEARTTLKRLKSDLEAKLDAGKLEREAEVKRLDKCGPSKLPGRERRKDGILSSVLKRTIAEFEEKKLDMFNLDRIIAMPNGDRDIGIASSISSSVLELLYAHLDLFLRRLMMRVIYIGEGYAADRPGIDDELRLGINAPLVHAAMEQIGLVHMIPGKRNNYRLLEPFPVRHMLPTLPRVDAQEGMKWADDVVPNVAKNIIDPTYGRAVANNSIRSEDEDDGLITKEEDEIQDEMYQRLEVIQDELDTLIDNEAENHLYARYISDQPKESSERPWFGDRFDWSTFETERSYLAHLRKSWLVDDGRRDAGKQSESRKAKQEGNAQGEEKTDQPDDVEGKDNEMMVMDDDDEETMSESLQYQRSSTIARLEKERFLLTKDIRRLVYRDSKRRNLPDHRPARFVQSKRTPVEKASSVKAFKSNDMVEDTSSEDDDEKGGDDGDDDGDDEDENEKYRTGRFSDEDDQGDNDDNDDNDDSHETDLHANNDYNTNDTNDACDKTDVETSILYGQSSIQLPLPSTRGHQTQGDEYNNATMLSNESDGSPRTHARIEVDSDPDRTDSE